MLATQSVSNDSGNNFANRDPWVPYLSSRKNPLIYLKFGLRGRCIYAQEMFIQTFYQEVRTNLCFFLLLQASLLYISCRLLFQGYFFMFFPHDKESYRSFKILLSLFKFQIIIFYSHTKSNIQIRFSVILK